ncbi:hypothetical protein H6802_02855 [Candidatus Nomurabacteria bacterium]|uniref:Mannosyl-glycoprotein endo-beta-N-acetylglucosamidase-like domain-containing protein n=1 Tax=candidate division WWE3 bacterium TaxID=2053526 RepID=A0A955E0A0_UNCKA|nr:hypothetical protein [candidate division WWE3 bacterium]MCB9823873.1 hypothetical protein [Candidatus Nomurabacteria bacterium]MCB9827147.1 hypothetical protein [Candidatus Nomurabacteria bacterium]MCB9827812.1 hypothetical protein [Candidatus Nomurabacteria bacterium]
MNNTARNTLIFKMTLPFAWLIFSTIVALIIIIYLNNSMLQASAPSNIFAYLGSQPKVLGVSDHAIFMQDSRVQKLEGVFKKYKCPIQGYGAKFVDEADKNNIPYWLVASIAFQESSCGKNVATNAAGETTNNLWGWAIYGKNAKTFDNIDHGIEVVSKYLHQTFYSKDITDTCDIMQVYTPGSNGSWCRGVNFFRDEILDF